MAVRDIMLIAALIFSFAIGFFIIHFVMGVTVEQMVANPVINESENAVTAISGITVVTGRLDYIVFGLFIGLILGLIVTGWFIGGNPIFMFAYFIVVVITVVCSTILSNVWEEVTQSSIFGVTVASFPISNNLLLNLPLYMSVIGIIGMVVMFAKPYIEGQQ